jgi:hypothetical protein
LEQIAADDDAEILSLAIRADDGRLDGEILFGFYVHYFLQGISLASA